MLAPPYVSTGELPPPETVQAWIDEAHARFRENRDGDVARTYPALAAVAPDAFGICTRRRPPRTRATRRSPGC